MNSTSQFEQNRSRHTNQKCYYFERGCCRFGNKCRYRHDAFPKETTWDSTKKQPQDNQRRLTSWELKERSRGKTCGICFEEVMSKKKGINKFGILPNCKHCFCFSCIKIWRSSVHFEHEVTKSCPECRTNSNYVYKNSYWVDAEYKDKFISDRNKKLSSIDCKYFRGGRGLCRQEGKCLFRHVPSLSHRQSPDLTCISLDDDDSSSALFRMMYENHLMDDDHLFDTDDWNSESDDEEDDLEAFCLLSEIL